MAKAFPMGACWDFNGDGRRDIFTAGFERTQSKSVDLKSLVVKAGCLTQTEVLGVRLINSHLLRMGHPSGSHSAMASPVSRLQMSQVSTAVADLNSIISKML